MKTLNHPQKAILKSVEIKTTKPCSCETYAILCQAKKTNCNNVLQTVSLKRDEILTSKFKALKDIFPYLVP